MGVFQFVVVVPALDLVVKACCASTCFVICLQILSFKCASAHTARQVNPARILRQVRHGSHCSTPFPQHRQRHCYPAFWAGKAAPSLSAYLDRHHMAAPHCAGILCRHGLLIRLQTIGAQ